ncbi:MAG TPA: 16S rRNA (adenine(1518)-N(6)/adenine(1519)-N(6))-dimethyltransferase RsmA [Longimicrobiales bacterium]|nr:16S rRNA (adenine(1518)-N(6)/adenine(1519)-N(6))-dimethyltransferase RsmA [Longimicrobiales bacterium]
MSAPHRAKKSLGQNFLIDPHQQRRIVDAVQARPGDTVLEIGPGQGALTRRLAERAGRLILVELDDDLAPALEREFADRPHVSVVHADFLDLDLHTIVSDVGSLRVVGNIPYNITTPIIFRLLERDVRPARIVLMIQKEVADRILAAPGTGEYGALSVGVRTVARVQRMFNVGRGAFRPVPRVDSTVIAIEPITPPPLSAAQEAAVRTLTRVAFSWRRKQLQKTLRSSPEYSLDAEGVASVEAATGIALEKRPEELPPEDFVRLADALGHSRRPEP